MAQPKTEDLGEDFSYILRMADTDIDGLKPLATALTAVKGVGARTANQICKNTGFDAASWGVPNPPTTPELFNRALPAGPVNPYVAASKSFNVLIYPLI